MSDIAAYLYTSLAVATQPSPHTHNCKTSQERRHTHSTPSLFLGCVLGVGSTFGAGVALSYTRVLAALRWVAMASMCACFDRAMMWLSYRRERGIGGALGQDWGVLNNGASHEECSEAVSSA